MAVIDKRLYVRRKLRFSTSKAVTLKPLCRKCRAMFATPQPTSRSISFGRRKGAKCAIVSFARASPSK